MVISQSFDILALCETWLDDSHLDSELFLNDYICIRSERSNSSQHGGVLIAVKNNIEYNNIDLSSSTAFPNCCASILVQSNNPFVLCLIYNPPHDSIYRWAPEILQDLIHFIMSKAIPYPVMFLGDFNLSHTTWNDLSSTNDYESTLVDVIVAHGLSQLIDFPTTNSKILDLCLTNQPELVVSILVAHFDQSNLFPSDHKPICITVKSSPPPQNR